MRFMGILDNAKQVARAVEEIHNLELYQRVLSLHSDIIELVEENSRLRNENSELTQRQVGLRWQHKQNPVAPTAWESHPLQKAQRMGQPPNFGNGRDVSRIDERIPCSSSAGGWNCRGPSVAQRKRSFRMTMGARASLTGAGPSLMFLAHAATKEAAPALPVLQSWAPRTPASPR